MISSNDINRIAIGPERSNSGLPGAGRHPVFGRVVRINPTVRPGSRSIPVYVQVRNEDRNLRGGMFAHGEVIINRVDQIVAVPVDAIRARCWRSSRAQTRRRHGHEAASHAHGRAGDDGLIAGRNRPPRR